MATHRTSSMDTPKTVFKAGKASCTMLASSWPMKPLVQLMPTTSQGWNERRAKNASGGGSAIRARIDGSARPFVLQRDLARAINLAAVLGLAREPVGPPADD